MRKIGTWNPPDRKTRIKILALLIFSLAVFLFVYNNAGEYKTPIVRVTKIDRSSKIVTVKQTLAQGKTRKISRKETSQKITAVRVNGSQKGTVLHLTNSYDSTLSYQENYHVGNFLFVKKGSGGWTITGQKRDYIMVFVLLLLFDCLILITGKEGFYTVVGLAVNVGIYFYTILEYTKGRNLFLLSILSVVVSACVILVLINGFNRISAVSIAATLITCAAVTGIAALALSISKGIQYEFMTFLPEPYTTKQANTALISEVLVGCLGSVVDICVTMTSSSQEIRHRTPSIRPKELFLSCREVADDIMGTMINIMLLTNVAAFLPIYVISVQNGFDIFTVIRNDFFFDVVRFLTGSIAIVLAIPISIAAAAYLMPAGRRISHDS